MVIVSHDIGVCHLMRQPGSISQCCWKVVSAFTAIMIPLCIVLPCLLITVISTNSDMTLPSYWQHWLKRVGMCSQIKQTHNLQMRSLLLCIPHSQMCLLYLRVLYIIADTDKIKRVNHTEIYILSCAVEQSALVWSLTSDSWKVIVLLYDSPEILWAGCERILYRYCAVPTKTEVFFYKCSHKVKA
jgi:hypothetical protein